MKVRLQKAMASSGVASRRQSEQMILDGLVSINGQITTTLGVKVDLEQDVIKVDGKRIQPKASGGEVWMLYKPKACITSNTDPQGRRTIVDFFPKTKARLFAAGRLDYDAEGLLILTNDGDLAYRLTHPSQKLWKHYFVKLKGKLGEELAQKLRQGPMIDKVQRKPVKLQILHHRNDKTWLEVGLAEGIKHQIKKMFDQVGFRVLKIKRFRVGNLDLGEMSPGESRRLSREDIQALLGETPYDKRPKG